MLRFPVSTGRHDRDEYLPRSGLPGRGRAEHCNRPLTNRQDVALQDDVAKNSLPEQGYCGPRHPANDLPKGHEHWVAALGFRRWHLFLQHVPMLDQLAVLDAEDVHYHQRLGAEAGVAPVQHHDIA